MPTKRADIYRFIICTGLRRKEMRQLTWNDIKMDGPNPSIQLRAEKTKNGKAASLPLQADLLAWAKKQTVADPSSKVFRSVPDVATLQKDLKTAGIKFVDEKGRRVDIHSLRHTFCTLVANSGATMISAHTVMRHGDPKLTANVYAHVGVFDTSGVMANVKLPTVQEPQITVSEMSQNPVSTSPDSSGQDADLTGENAVATLTNSRPSTQVD